MRDTLIEQGSGVPWPVQVGCPPLLAEAFQPRPALREKIQAGLDAGPTVLTQFSAGTGGTGKSQLAAAVFAAARECGTDLLVWVNAARPKAVLAAYAQARESVAGSADPVPWDARQRAEAFLTWLKTADRSWLVVLDDVADPADMAGFWPAGRRGRVLVTTRCRAAAAGAPGWTLVEIGGFEPHESLAYLRDNVAAAECAGRVPADVVEGAQELAVELGHLPLALAHAAAVVLNEAISCAEYRAQFADRSRHLAELFPDASAADEHTRTVATTWSLAIDRADALAPCGLARRALQLGAMAHPSGVPDTLWATKAARAYLAADRSSGRADAPQPARPAGAAGQADGHGAAHTVSEQDARRALDNLRQLSLITYEPGAGPRVVRVHALVQQAAADHLTGAQKAALAQAAADALEQAEITPARFLIDLNKTATYVFTRGAPFFVFSHFTFLVDYVKAWRKEQGDQAVADALADPEATVSGRSFMTKLVRWQRIPLGIKPWIMLAALTLNLVLLPVWLFLSVLKSAWLILEKGVRSVPPLITAVVVVFVTSDAWRILGTGFTRRFILLVLVFMLASLLFLIRFEDYWEEDIKASEDEADILLRGIRGWHRMEFHKLIDMGAGPAPIVKPTRLGTRVAVYGGYVAISAFSLIVAALFVSGSLILVGLILINRTETHDLAHSAHIYWTLPWWHLVLTRELVSLSLALGAFSAFFLVAAQRIKDRDAFMKDALVRLRRALLVYSVYCRAHDRAADWTGVPVKSELLAGGRVQGGRQQRNSAARAGQSGAAVRAGGARRAIGAAGTGLESAPARGEPGPADGVEP